MMPQSGDWCHLSWTEWQPFKADFVRSSAPAFPGIYRIRRAGIAKRLTYIGQTNRTLRERLSALASGTYAERCPFNDPHTAAPHLWLMTKLDGAQLEFSCALVVGGRRTLRGTEDMLLWRHRVENGCSTEANYGRFYPGWSRLTNRWVERGGIKRSVERLGDDQELRNFGAVPPAHGRTGSLPLLVAAARHPLHLSVGPAANFRACVCIATGDTSPPARCGERVKVRITLPVPSVVM